MMKQRILGNVTNRLPNIGTYNGTFTQYNGILTYDHKFNAPFEGNKWTNALYMIEKYDFTDEFSLTGEGHYEFAHYDINVNYSTNGTALISSGNEANGSLADNLHNFDFELTISYKYSHTGTIYAKYERGYFSLSPILCLDAITEFIKQQNLKEKLAILLNLV